MNKREIQRPRRIQVELTAVWGDDDAESTIKISCRRWKQIQEGVEYSASAWAWYEGRRFSVDWHFSGGNVSVHDKEGDEHVIDLPVGELIAQTIT